MKLLIVGTVGRPITGTTVSLAHLINSLKAEGISLLTINTAGIRNPKVLESLRKYLEFISRLWKLSYKADVVSVHLAEAALPFSLLPCWCICLIRSKPLIVRVFGGRGYRSLVGWKRFISIFVLRRTNLYLGQTKELCDDAVQMGFKCVRWFPTSRPEVGKIILKDQQKSKFRFVFIGRIIRKKGIEEILETSLDLPDGISIDLFGPLGEDYSKEYFNKIDTINYRGVISPKDIQVVLRNYHALILPTYFDDEGYPGVILEAMSAGLPTICTKWKALPELVDENSGILIPIKNSGALREAMVRLKNNKNLYNRLSRGSIQRFQKFTSEKWTKNFINYAKAIWESREPPIYS